MGDERLRYSDQYRRLQCEYRSKLPERMKRIDAAWDALSNGLWDAEQFSQFYRSVHNLVGTGKSFGFASVSDLAGQLDRILAGFLSELERPTPEQKLAIESCLLVLRNEVQKATLAGEVMEPPQPSYPEAGRGTGWERRTVCLVESDSEKGREIAQQVGHFGHAVRVFDSLDACRKSLGGIPPSLLIVDLPAGGRTTAGLSGDKGEDWTPAAPLIVLSSDDTVQARLEAVRLGAKAYFTHPVDIQELVDAIDGLRPQEQQDPFKVFLVDDDPALVNYYALVLEQVGMKTAKITDPLAAMTPLNEFRPDLILLDFHMPGCSGPELAAIIRQQRAYVGIPIVFLSSETNLDRQLDAMLTGGDDFLTKPIHPDHLVAMVLSRARRHRILRSFMMRDSLTGLLTHSYLKEHLAIEIDRARRQGTPLAYALVDIDRFKSVNDTYGHPSGDRVLEALARLLRQRLRRTDIIGRYGGDEVAVVFPFTCGTDAWDLMEAIREDFHRIRHTSGDAHYFLSFSCGIAAFPGLDDASAVNEAADHALYEAKSSGRNRVQLAVQVPPSTVAPGG